MSSSQVIVNPLCACLTQLQVWVGEVLALLFAGSGEPGALLAVPHTRHNYCSVETSKRLPKLESTFYDLCLLHGVLLGKQL